MGGWQSAARSETGKVRKYNEDALLVSPGQGLWAIADGMGGHLNGALASRCIIDGLSALALHGSLAQRVDQVRNALAALNQRLSQDLTLASGEQDTIMGSTVVYCWSRVTVLPACGRATADVISGVKKSCFN